MTQQLALGRGATYRLDHLLSRGACGEVWSAIWLEGRQAVAIKRIRGDREADLDLLDLMKSGLRREIAFLERVRAPHLVRIKRAGTCNALPVMVLEQLDRSLHDVLLQNREFPAWGPARVMASLEVLRQVAEGLNVLHSRGWRHLDLKPRNLLVTPPGPLGRRVKIADLGCALPNEERIHGPAGTAGWQAPEQIFPAARDAYVTDARTDVYALGLLFFFLLTGRRTAFAEMTRDRSSEAEGATPSLAPAAWEGLSNSDRCHIVGAVEEVIAPRCQSSSDPVFGSCAPMLAVKGRLQESAAINQCVVLLDRLLAGKPENRPADAGAALLVIARAIQDCRNLANNQRM